MAWLKLVGMIPPDEGNAWVSGGIIVEPLRPERDSDWADGQRRVVWPIVGKLALAGTRFETLTAGEVLLPGADIGESVYPPMVRIIVDLVDQKGKPRRFQAQGIIGASARGEWNINAPLTGVVEKGLNYGPSSLVETTLEQMQAMNKEGRQLLAHTAQMQADWATAPRTLLHGTAAQRRALVVDPPRRVLYLEDDTHRQLNYYPGTGWRDVYGNDPDAAPPPPDTGVY